MELSSLIRFAELFSVLLRRTASCWVLSFSATSSSLRYDAAVAFVYSYGGIMYTKISTASRSCEAGTGEESEFAYASKAVRHRL